MWDSPETLQDICVEYISRNINLVINAVLDVNGNTVKYLFKNSLLRFPCSVSEQLFSALNDIGLTDQLLSIFDPSVTRLNRVYVGEDSKISAKGLRVLRFHKISELSAVGLSNITISELVGCLGDWTLENLLLLNVSNSTFLSSEKIHIFIALSKLKNLICLDVSFTEFNSQGLEIVAEDLRCLENLNISGTEVTDISPLKKCKDRLKFLSMYNLKISHTNTFLPVLQKLHKLQHLDISDDKDEPYELATVNMSAFSEFLKDPGCLLSLISLDITGKNGVDADTLKAFLKNHPQMRFLGLLETEACQDDFFCEISDPVFKHKLVVSGFASESQVLVSLRRYMQRKFYLQKSLCYLYTFIQNLPDVRLDIVQLVLQSMKTYPKILSVQMAATACLYNLTKFGLSSMIHTSVLKQIVDYTLVAMENFPKQQQLQKNTLLTLCSDRMLVDVSFDRYHCAELVMNSLMAFDDPAMNRMSVAICSILAARISTVETSNLGEKSAYMIRLLDIVKSKADHGEIDIMMKFTLSALWNLTDESPRTCSVFLESGGMKLFLDVLRKFPGESAVETKVLGLMNNIAEVNYLREQLMHEDFISILKQLLHSEHIDVSYFAAGIIAHLASEGENFWNCNCISWNDVILELGSTIARWSVPETEMVAYRSFNPFYPLFSCSNAYQVQLWAAWAIYHVCLKNSKRYCKMIIEDGGAQILKNLLRDPELHPSVADICKEILRIVKEEFPNMINTSL